MMVDVGPKFIGEVRSLREPTLPYSSRFRTKSTDQRVGGSGVAKSRLAIGLSLLAS
jgi:hypothetical protein